MKPVIIFGAKPGVMKSVVIDDCTEYFEFGANEIFDVNAVAKPTKIFGALLLADAVETGSDTTPTLHTVLKILSNRQQ